MPDRRRRPAVHRPGAVPGLQHPELPFIGGGDHYRAAFSEAGGLIKGDDVRIAGVKVGKVDKVDLAGNHVMVDFRVTEPVALRHPDRRQRPDEDPARRRSTSPSSRPAAASSRRTARSRSTRTVSSYDVVDAFTDLATTTEQIDTDQLAKSLTTLATEFKDSPPDVKAALDGLTRLSNTIASRDDELQAAARLGQQRHRHPRRAQQGRSSRSSRTPTCCSSSSTPAATRSTRCSPTPRRWPSRSPAWCATTAPSSSPRSTS